MIKIINQQTLSIAIGILLIVTAVGYLLSADASPDALPLTSLAEIKQSVNVIAAEPKDESVSISANGIIEASSISHVNPRVVGHVEYVSDQLAVGKKVEKGDHLLTINDLGYQVAVSEAKLALESARLRVMQEQARSKQALRDIASVNSQKAAKSELAKRVPQLNEAEADFAAKKIALQEAKENMAHTKIVAPFDGLILSINVNKGEWVNLDDDMFTLVDPSSLEVQASLTNDQWELIDPSSVIGTSVQVTTNMRGKQAWPGVIKNINPVINEKTGTLAVIIGLHNDQVVSTLPIGVFSQITFVGKTFESSQWVSQTALLPSSEVWVVSVENTLSKVPVTVLQYRDQYVLVSYDLTKNTPLGIVEKAQISFIEGQSIDPIFVLSGANEKIFNSSISENTLPNKNYL